jgi:hypothetical protein
MFSGHLKGPCSLNFKIQVSAFRVKKRGVCFEGAYTTKRLVPGSPSRYMGAARSLLTSQMRRRQGAYRYRNCTTMQSLGTNFLVVFAVEAVRMIQLSFPLFCGFTIPSRVKYLYSIYSLIAAQKRHFR